MIDKRVCDADHKWFNANIIVHIQCEVYWNTF